LHRFKGEEVPQDKLKKILEAGLQASSAFNIWNISAQKLSKWDE
jgi:hypothetical protein